MARARATTAGATTKLYFVRCAEALARRRCLERNHDPGTSLIVSGNTFELLKIRFEPLGPEWDRVKVIDFGLSRVVGRDDLLTETGVVLGTPAYMSP